MRGLAAVLLGGARPTGAGLSKTGGDIGNSEVPKIRKQMVNITTRSGKGRLANQRTTPKRVKRADARVDILTGGLADKKDYTKLPQRQLRKGTQHEQEHTDKPAIAREIAGDHVAEDPKYYTHLAAVEKKAAAPAGLLAVLLAATAQS